MADMLNELPALAERQRREIERARRAAFRPGLAVVVVAVL
jgi:predicted N-acyltransferase